jgi:hypothetical protein
LGLEAVALLAYRRRARGCHMIRSISKRRTHVGHSITWRVFRRRYEAAAIATLPKLNQRLWQIAADDLERLASPAYLADVAAVVPHFAAALRAEGVDSASLEIYEGRIEDALDWAAEVGLLAGELEEVNA